MTTKESLLQIQRDLLSISALVEEQIGRIDRIMMESGVKPEMDASDFEKSAIEA